MEAIFEIFGQALLELLIWSGVDIFEQRKSSFMRTKIINSLIEENHKHYIFENTPKTELTNKNLPLTDNKYEIFVDTKCIYIFPYFSKLGKIRYNIPIIITNKEIKKTFRSYLREFAEPMHFRIRQTMKGRADVFLKTVEHREELSFMHLTEIEIEQLSEIFSKPTFVLNQNLEIERLQSKT